MNKILQKRIDEEAEEYANSTTSNLLNVFETTGRFEGFEQGATFALRNQWISVEEALPPYEYVLTCQDDNGSVQSVAIEICQDGKWYGVDDEVTDREPDYWMLIPSFSKEKK